MLLSVGITPGGPTVGSTQGKYASKSIVYPSPIIHIVGDDRDLIPRVGPHEPGPGRDSWGEHDIPVNIRITQSGIEAWLVGRVPIIETCLDATPREHSDMFLPTDSLRGAPPCLPILARCALPYGALRCSLRCAGGSLCSVLGLANIYSERLDKCT